MSWRTNYEWEELVRRLASERDLCLAWAILSTIFLAICLLK